MSDEDDDQQAEAILAEAVTESDDSADDDQVDVDKLRKDLDKARKDVEKWQSLSRKNQERARENADAASRAKSVEEQLSELRQQLSDRDVADVERSSRIAMSQLQAALAEQGFRKEDVDGLLDQIDGVRLLNQGEPDPEAIQRIAGSLTRVAGRATPDHDQGRRGDDAPTDMNAFIRRAAGRG